MEGGGREGVGGKGGEREREREREDVDVPCGPLRCLVVPLLVKIANGCLRWLCICV